MHKNQSIWSKMNIDWVIVNLATESCPISRVQSKKTKQYFFTIFIDVRPIICYPVQRLYNQHKYQFIWSKMNIDWVIVNWATESSPISRVKKTKNGEKYYFSFWIYLIFVSSIWLNQPLRSQPAMWQWSIRPSFDWFDFWFWKSQVYYVITRLMGLK